MIFYYLRIGVYLWQYLSFWKGHTWQRRHRGDLLSVWDWELPNLFGEDADFPRFEDFGEAVVVFLLLARLERGVFAFVAGEVEVDNVLARRHVQEC